MANASSGMFNSSESNLTVTVMEDGPSESELALLETCRLWRPAGTVYLLFALPIWLGMLAIWGCSVCRWNSHLARDLHRLLTWIPVIQTVHAILSGLHFNLCPWRSSFEKVAGAAWVVVAILKDPVMLVWCVATTPQIASHCPSPEPLALPPPPGRDCLSCAHHRPWQLAYGSEGMVHHAQPSANARDRPVGPRRHSPLRLRDPPDEYAAADCAGASDGRNPCHALGARTRSLSCVAPRRFRMRRDPPPFPLYWVPAPFHCTSSVGNRPEPPPRLRKGARGRASTCRGCSLCSLRS